MAIRYNDGGENDPPLPVPGIEMARLGAETAANSQTSMLDQATELANPAEIVAALTLVAGIEATDNDEDLLSEQALSRLKSIAPNQDLSSLADLIAHINALSMELPSNQMTKDFHAARIWSLRARTLANSLLTENPDELAYKQKLVTESTTCAMEHLSVFAEDFPSVGFEIYKEPDLIWLRNTPEFHASDLVMPGSDRD